MAVQDNKKYYFFSTLAHLLVLGGFVLGFDSVTPMVVFENTNKNDIISAVVLGDSPDSKILPEKPPAQEVVKALPKKVEPKKEEVKLPSSKPHPVEKPDKDVIALKKAEKKKLDELKALQEKMQRELFANNLLADIKKQKKIKQKELQKQFKKTLHEQAEKSLRQQLLNEEIKLQGTEVRQSQGEVNKYKALIIQAISQHWIVPTQANKSLYCELMIRVAPGGLVLDVQVTKSSGDPSLDNSARAAVLKASPLPVPLEANDFEAFRHFVLKVKPENVVG